MVQPILSAEAELQALLMRYDYGALPPGIAARVAALQGIIVQECEYYDLTGNRLASEQPAAVIQPVRLAAAITFTSVLSAAEDGMVADRSA